MRRTALRIITAIQLTRLTMAFGAISDIWFIILFTKSEQEYSHVPVHHDVHLFAALIAGATVAIGLFAYGASLNDVLDVRHDSTFSPDKPIPAGRIRLGQAIVLTVGALIVAMLGAIGLGTGAVAMTLVTAAGLLFYNAAGKYIPAVGMTTVGLIHATHMMIPNHELEFTLPVILVMTHAMTIALIVHVWEDKRPRLRNRAIVATIVGWVAWTIILLVLGTRHGHLWPKNTSVLGIFAPIAAILAFLCVAWWKTSSVSGPAAAEKLKRYGAMWQSLYGAAWLLGLGLTTEALWIGVFALAGFAAMTLIKEITGFSDRPVAYR